MSVAIQKIDGVESVTVSLTEGRAKIRLKPGNTVRLSALRGAIEENGFTPREASVVVVGELKSAGGQRALVVTGTNESLTAQTVAQGVPEGTPIVATGTVAVLQKGASERIHITKADPRTQ